MNLSGNLKNLFGIFKSKNKTRNFLSPSLIIYLTLICGLAVFFSEDIRWSFDNRILLLIGTGIVILIKSFFLTYYNISFSVRENNWIVLVANITALAISITSILMGINSLKETTFPFNIFFSFLIVGIITYLQIILSHLEYKKKLFISLILFYSLILLTLQQRPFDLDIQRVYNASFKFIETASLVALILESLTFFNVSKSFLKAIQDEKDEDSVG
jgi:hypothetical protein